LSKPATLTIYYYVSNSSYKYRTSLSLRAAVAEKCLD